MKECRDIRELMSAALDGELAPAEQARLDSHLPGCPRCRAALAELRATVRLVKGVEAVEPPPWLTAKVMARLRSETEQRRSLWQRLFLPLPVKLPLQTAALVVLCVTGYYLAKSTAPQVDLSAPPGAERLKETTPAPTAPSQVPQTPPGPAGSAPKAKPSTKAAPPAPANPSPVPSPAPLKEYAPPPPATEPAPAAPGPVPEAPPTMRPASPFFSSQDAGSAAPPKKAAKARRQPERAPEAPAKEEMLRDAESVRAGVAAPAPLTATFRLTANDAAAAGQAITDQLRTLGAIISNSRGRTITARLEAARLAELQESLARLGPLREKPALPAGATGPVLVTISW
jgi:putative zinc finger protein/predicted integral membrane protein DUF2275